LTKREFRRASVGNPIRVARDGEEALDHLFATAGRAKRVRTLPSLILLDLGLPKTSGIEVLRKIKSDPRTRYIPVVILTASRYDRDILECARLGAENYIIKPLQFSGLCKVALKLRLTFALVSSEPKSFPPAPTPRDRAAKSR
jgi:CheY-like chemotaxis protein